jgi:hypothetical protein
LTLWASPFARALPELQRVKSHPRAMGDAEIQEVERSPPEGDALARADSPPSALSLCPLAGGVSTSGWTIGSGFVGNPEYALGGRLVLAMLQL